RRLPGPRACRSRIPPRRSDAPGHGNRRSGTPGLQNTAAESSWSSCYPLDVWRNGGDRLGGDGLWIGGPDCRVEQFKRERPRVVQGDETLEYGLQGGDPFPRKRAVLLLGHFQWWQGRRIGEMYVADFPGTNQGEVLHLAG